MLNKILIKMIMKQLIKDITELTFIYCTYDIKGKKLNYEIKITALLQKSNITIIKHKTIRIENWIELITNYENIRKKLRDELVDKIKEE